MQVDLPKKGTAQKMTDVKVIVVSFAIELVVGL